MSNIDNHIVTIRFDNESFQRNLEATLRSLDKLRQGLEFSGAKQGLNDLSNAGKNFTMGPIGTAVEGASSKFLAFATIGITALTRVSNAAITAGASLVKSFTFGPIQQGFQEFETNMNSIQTILSNTKADGSTLEDVNGALDQLNQYSDKTIYNFSEMARNIGTFTAAGVGLDDSVNAIKGIANLAAISGSNSQQASTAMYQLSQALAAGKVNLMDWNSVVNAGMGGEVFKKALFETGKAMKTITDVPLGASFEEWEKKGGTFREQMQSGWLTADVLSTTLSAFSGDLDAAALSAMGFSDAAAQEMVDLGKMGIEAATEVKTMTQLVGTVKESIASGWSMTFRTIVGDFGESKKLFTEINTAIGGFVSASADARNQLLGEWKFFGGRETLINGLKDAFGALGNVFQAVKNAFRGIFPKTTSKELLEMTNAFADFTAKIEKLTRDNLPKITSLFKGLFAGLEIGWTVIKEVAKLFAGLFGTLASASSGPALGFFGKISSALIKMNESLVEGGGIAEFFDKIASAIKNPAKALEDFKDAIGDMFSGGGIPGGEAATSIFERLGQRFEQLGKIGEAVGDVWTYLADRFEGVRKVLGDIWNHLSTWFGELKDRIAEVFTAGDFNEIVDLVNVGVLGGIFVVLRKFFKTFKDGINIDFGGGIMEKVNSALDGLTGKLQAMQTNIKAEALLKIAAAIGIIALSVTLLAMIDSEALAKAMTALAVGFGQLMGAFAILNTISTTGGAAKLVILSAGLILLATAIGILTLSVKILSTMGWEELAKGLLGVIVLLVGLTAATKLIAADTSGMIRAGVAMIAISLALLLLSLAVKAFADMEWESMAQGLVGIGAGLVLLTTAVNFMPAAGLVQAGAGIILLAIGLRILAEAVEEFAEMSWGEMAKGLIGVGVGLGLIVLLTNTMPIGGLVAIGAGLILVSIALNIMAKAVETMGGMPLGEMAKGLGALAAMLLILVLATNAMNGALPGAAAIVIVAGALYILSGVLVELSKLKVNELLIALGAIAGVLLILGIAGALLTPVIPTLLGLGIALGLLGVAFALFGVGAILVAKAFEILAQSLEGGIQAILGGIELLAGATPRIVEVIATAIIGMVTEILEAIPDLVDAFKEVFLHILETIIEVAPKIAEAFVAIMGSMISAAIVLIPRIVELGYAIVVALLTGIRDNIGEIVELAVGIILNFAAALLLQIPVLVETAVTLIVAFINAIGENMQPIVQAGIDLITNFMGAIAGAQSQIVTAAVSIVIAFVGAIGANISRIVTAGASILQNLMIGIANNIIKVSNTAVTIITTLITTFANNATKIATAGTNALVAFLKGISDNMNRFVTAVTNLIVTFINTISNNLNRIITAGANLLVNFVTGLGNNMHRVVTAGVDAILKFIEGVGSQAIRLARGAADALIDFLNGLATAIREKGPQIRRAGGNVADAIIDGIVDGITDGVSSVVNAISDMAGSAVDAAKDFFGIGSPSKVFMDIGHSVVHGLSTGIDKDAPLAAKSANALAGKAVDGFQEVFMKMPSLLGDMKEFNPTITPVLDLTKVKMGAKTLGGLMPGSSIRPDVSYGNARSISAATLAQQQSTETPSIAGPSEIKFEQNIYAPTELSTNDIYRNTRSQIALAKEELNIV